jgi:HPt (histidine-containing phosphotransfer) domain-containing protein
LGGDASPVREIVATFLSDAEARMGEMKATLAAKDRDGLSRAAHTLKSTSMLVGAVGLSQVSKQLETEARVAAWPELERQVAEAAARWATVKPKLVALRSR